MENKILNISNISKSFSLNNKKQKVIKDINFTVDRGEFVCIVGPSGCGKSSLLRVIAQLVPSDNGTIESDNLKYSFIFQNFALFPWLTVKENIEFGLKMSGASKSEMNSEAKKRIEEVGLKGWEEKHPKELSGGMKQRVGIARALSIHPDILLLDEPFSALDVLTANKLRKELLEIWKKNNLTMIMVSHLIEEAVELGDKVIVLSQAPGTVKSITEINLPRPRNSRSDAFYSYVDVITKLIE